MSIRVIYLNKCIQIQPALASVDFCNEWLHHVLNLVKSCYTKPLWDNNTRIWYQHTYLSKLKEKKSFCWTRSWLLLECLMMKSSMVFEREALPIFTSTARLPYVIHVFPGLPRFSLSSVLYWTQTREQQQQQKQGRPGNEASTQLYICDGGSSLASVFAWLCKNRQKRSGESHYKNDITTTKCIDHSEFPSL